MHDNSIEQLLGKKIHSRTQKLDYKAHHDELTGLQNRTNLFVDVQNAIKQLKTPDTKCAVFFLRLE